MMRDDERVRDGWFVRTIAWLAVTGGLPDGHGFQRVALSPRGVLGVCRSAPFGHVTPPLAVEFVHERRVRLGVAAGLGRLVVVELRGANREGLQLVALAPLAPPLCLGGECIGGGLRRRRVPVLVDPLWLDSLLELYGVLR